MFAALVGVLGVLAYAGADFHGNTRAVGQFLTGVTSVTVGGFLAYRRPHHPAGWLLLVAGTASWFTFSGSSGLDWMFQQSWTPYWLANTVLHLATPGWIVTRGVYVVLLPLVIASTWRRPSSVRLERSIAVVAVVAITTTAVAHSVATTFGSFAGEAPVGAARFAGDLLPWGHRAIWVCGLLALVDMVVGVPSAPEDVRRQHLWLALAVALLLLPTVNSLTSDAIGGSIGPLEEDFERWAEGILPLVVAAGVLSHGVFDVRVVLRRVTVYLGLAALAGSAYVAAVAAVAVFTDGGTTGPVVGAGVVAVTVVPTYAWVQRLATRFVFGRRDDPYEVVTALGDRLAQAPRDEQALQLVTDTLREQLRLPFVAVELVLDGAPVRVAASGEPTDAVDRFAVVHQGVELGSLVVARRTEHEPFRQSEQALLADFARQAGVVAHNAALSEALRRSRAFLLAAREEERQRIRRDLHDGLGPTLATVSLGLGAAAERLTDDPDLATLLRDLEGELREAVADIRRLVYDLRPPALDDLGLVQAVRAHARTLQDRTTEDRTHVDFELDAPAPRIELPSAVEVAAYRVALEAMTNVVRHAGARRCWVSIEPGTTLRICVDDDGIGVGPDIVPGIGLRSMLDRVRELGGTLEVVARRPCGTRVEARFPLLEVAPA